METKNYPYKVLLYQDTKPEIVAEHLRFSGFEVIIATNSDATQLIKEKKYDICILSHYRPGLPGDLKLLKFLKAFDQEIPVIIVSDLSKPIAVIEAFNEGADDYVIKPYNLNELICRIKAVLRRSKTRVKAKKTEYNIGQYKFNTETSILLFNGNEQKLSKKESGVLSMLCYYMNDVTPKKMLMQNLWEVDNYFNRRSLDVYIYKLREYLSQDPSVSIITRKGIGYSLVDKEQEE